MMILLIIAGVFVGTIAIIGVCVIWATVLEVLVKICISVIDEWLKHHKK